MAMLAESKRRHQSFALQPRGKPLYEDSNNFGSKMLSKMGWEPGKGLGANEDGKLDFIKVKYKNDIQGIGFEARDDQWTQHEDGFNKLLQTLSNSNSQQNSDDEEERRPVMGFAKAESDSGKVKYKPSGESLEQKSKTSRARVHYKKFTKGKDLSQYSEKDLANIFGKKANDSKEMTPVTPPLEGSTPVEETFLSSIFTTTSGLSLSDYFKMKMKNKNSADTGEAVVEPDLEKPKKKKKKNKDAEHPQEVIVEVEEEVVEKKKKKKKQKQPAEILSDGDGTAITENDDQLKKKKKRKEQVEVTIEEPELIVENQNNNEPATKSKKRKHQDIEVEVVNKKKKTKKKSSLPEETSSMTTQPNLLKQSELEFNRIRAEQICSYLQNCQRLMAQTTLLVHPVTAEIIRNANISAFKGSNISQIIGYGLTQDVGLDVLKDVKVNLVQMLQETVTAENQNLIIF